MALILDTSGVIALLSRADTAHTACVDVASHETELVVPPLTLVEIDYWCRKSGASGAFAQFAADIRRGSYALATFPVSDLERCIDIGDTYADLDLGIVDASVVALAERLSITRVLSLDRRDFSVIRPRHCAALALLPERT